MNKIRKQPKRSSKKVLLPSFRNPFKESQPYLPQTIADNLCKLDTLALRSIDEIIEEPVDHYSMNLHRMRLALHEQELKLSSIK